MSANNLEKNPVHLGQNATAVVEPEFTGTMDWYEAYGNRHVEDGKEGRLVSKFTFTESWDTWEQHPHGSEVVVCLEGEVELVQEINGQEVKVKLESSGEYAINPPGVWHTTNVVKGPCTMLFITAGLGTQMRPRAMEATNKGPSAE